MRQRPRRLRTSPVMRAMVAQTSVEPRQLVLPVFVAEGASEPQPISSMPGVVQHTLDTLRKTAVEAAQAGLAGVMLFGVPATKDAQGSGALDEHGILTEAVRAVRQEVGDDCLVMTDVCLDEFTDHGHCGVLTPGGAVDNDATVAIYAEMAVLHAEAGAHVVAPSGMMDGQVGAIRDALEAAGHVDTAILAYAAKYASAFYGPFREAVASSLQGDRKTYQQDGANLREALHEVALDLAEGADLVMVKPALRDLEGPVGEDDVRTRPTDRGERLADGGVAVDPAVRGGRLDHRVLARDVVRRDRHVHHLADRADHVEVGQRRLDHDEVGALGEVEGDLVQRLAQVG
ncbi:MAG: porphobilinogen synthase, partial [Propionibacteriaceae bacterium]